MKLFRLLASASVVAAYALSSGLCYAQQAAPAPSPAVVNASDGKESKEAKKVVEQPKPPEPRFKIYGWVEGGITGNPDSPTDNHNFGHLFTDRSNEPLLNQLSVVAERALDPNATGFDWGFKAWFMYGSDARYTKSVGFMPTVTDDRVQPDFPELYASAHIPSTNPATIQRNGDRPRRAAITAVSGASAASTISDVAIISIGALCDRISAKPDA